MRRKAPTAPPSSRCRRSRDRRTAGGDSRLFSRAPGAQQAASRPKRQSGEETPMRRIRQRGAFLLGLITLVIFTAACSSPGPQDLVSKRYQVQVTAPKGWDKRDAQFAWDGNGLPDDIQGSGDFAYVADPRNGDHKFGLAAIPVAQGMHLAAWQAAMARFVPVAGCVNSGPVRRTTLGG